MLFLAEIIVLSVRILSCNLRFVSFSLIFKIIGRKEMLSSAKKLFVFCIFCIIIYFSYRTISANFEEGLFEAGGDKFVEDPENWPFT